MTKYKVAIKSKRVKEALAIEFNLETATAPETNARKSRWPDFLPKRVSIGQRAIRPPANEDRAKWRILRRAGSRACDGGSAA